MAEVVLDLGMVLNQLVDLVVVDVVMLVLLVPDLLMEMEAQTIQVVVLEVVDLVEQQDIMVE